MFKKDAFHAIFIMSDNISYRKELQTIARHENFKPINKQIESFHNCRN